MLLDVNAIGRKLRRTNVELVVDTRSENCRDRSNRVVNLCDDNRYDDDDDDDSVVRTDTRKKKANSFRSGRVAVQLRHLFIENGRETQEHERSRKTRRFAEN